MAHICSLDGCGDDPRITVIIGDETLEFCSESHTIQELGYRAGLDASVFDEVERRRAMATPLAYLDRTV